MATVARQWIARSPEETHSIIAGWEVIELREGESAMPIIAQGLSEGDARVIAAAMPKEPAEKDTVHSITDLITWKVSALAELDVLHHGIGVQHAEASGRAKTKAVPVTRLREWLRMVARIREQVELIQEPEKA